MAKKVVYLIGAGASHACVKSVGSAHGILMRDLGPILADKVRALVEAEYSNEASLKALANEVIDESTDFEHVITFLDDAPSMIHRKFADELRTIFESELRARLKLIEEEIGRTPNDLYSALLDMYRVPNCPEELGGILTINYDEYIEEAAASTYGTRVDHGIEISGIVGNQPPLKLLKLHGSFNWKSVWPIAKGNGGTPLWIPPGIQKAKDRYPFNALWGLAREVLDCDVLRVIGCKLGANDWDLISLLFTTRHASSTRRPYLIEIVDAPLHAEQVKAQFPYLDVRSLLEIDTIGPQLVSEFTGSGPKTFGSLSPEEQSSIREAAGRDKNWFRLWLKQMAESLFTELGSVRTPCGEFEKLLEAPA